LATYLLWNGLHNGNRGVTRLTESGLSIVEWKPIVGSIPPLSEKQWEEEFDKYKSSPEYEKLNFGMTLEAFKRIYWMEWTHRELGRALGIVFAVPFAYFTAKGWLRGRELAQSTGLLLLGGFQVSIFVYLGCDPYFYHYHRHRHHRYIGITRMVYGKKWS